MPHDLGLSKTAYQELRKAVEDEDLMHQELAWCKDDWTFIRERAEFCGELFAMKTEEQQELIELLSRYRNKQDPSSRLMAIIIATACLTKFHLWESVGLEERADLGKLIKHNVPKLDALNTDNMRWKRFFTVNFVSKAETISAKPPVAGECKSYAECFA